jgi:hypothetical protein
MQANTTYSACLTQYPMGYSSNPFDINLLPRLAQSWAQENK